MLEKRLRNDLTSFLKKYAKWFDDYNANEMPNTDTVNEVYKWMSAELKQVVTSKKFALLYKLALERYRENKKGK